MILARRMTIIGLVAVIFAMLFSMAVENSSRGGYYRQAGNTMSCLPHDGIVCRSLIK